MNSSHRIFNNRPPSPLGSPLPSKSSIKVNKFKAFFLKIFYRIAQTITKRDRSKLFKAKLIHLKKDTKKTPFHFIFGKSLVANTRNIGRLSVLVKKEDVKEIEKLLVKCKKLLKDKEISNIKINKSQKPESIIIDGICAGITLDVATNYLIKGQNIAEIIEKNKGGGSAKAAANQAVFAYLDISLQYPHLVIELLKDLKEMAKTDDTNPLYQVDFDKIGQCLIYLDPDLRQSPSFSAVYDVGTESLNLDDFIFTFVSYIHQEYKNGHQKSLWLGTQDNPLHIKDFEEFLKGMLAQIEEKYADSIAKASLEELPEINQKKEKDIHTFKWLFSILEYKQGLMLQAKKMQAGTTTTQIAKKVPKKGRAAIAKRGTPYTVISHPIISPTFRHLAEEFFKNERYRAVARARGLKLESVSEVMGSHWAHESNDSYLQNISKLNPGIYSVSITHKTGLHAINYVKISDSEGYIIDPSGAQIRCQDTAHTIEQFHKLLSLIPEPDPTVFHKKGKLNHLLHFQRFTVADRADLQPK